MMRRILLFCGVSSPLLYAAADALAGLRWEGYSFRDQTISDWARPSTSCPPAYLIGEHQDDLTGRETDVDVTKGQWPRFDTLIQSIELTP